MSDFNRVFLLGRIGNTLELKTSAQGKPYLKLSIATHSFRTGGQKVTVWHKVVVFGAQAELCAMYLQKGSQVLVEGSLDINTYETEDGKKQSYVSVLANRIQFLSGRIQTQSGKDDNQFEEPSVYEEKQNSFAS